MRLSESLKRRLVVESWTDTNGQFWKFDIREPTAFETREEAKIVHSGEGSLEEITNQIREFLYERAKLDRQRNVAAKIQASRDKAERDSLCMTPKQYRKYKRGAVNAK